MQINRLLILILMFFTSIQGFSQNSKVNLSGVVLVDNGKPAEGVSVALKGTSYSTLTNEKGEFEISAAPGNYTLSITYVGYKSKQTKINLDQSKTIPAITIEEDMAALDEVQVKGKSKVQRVREEAFNITAVDLKQLYNTSADLNQVLNRTTGVRVRETGGMGSEFKFTLNGFSGDQVKFFLDGIPIDNYGSSFTLNNIPVTMAERVDVYKGVVPVELGGDAIGGAVNIVTNKSANKFIDASYSYGSFNTHKAAINTRFTSKNGIVANLNAFLNYSDNSYKIDAQIPDSFSGVYGPEQKLKHFHDGYKQGTIMAEVGVKDKSYADYLLVGLAGSANKKEVQQGATMFAVVGDAFTESKNIVSSLKYKKTNLFVKNLTASLAASYNIAEERKIDTSSARYDWSGNYTVKNYDSGGEINPNEKSIMVFDVKSLQSNANLKYDVNENNSFALNYTYLGYKRKEVNEYDPEDIPTQPYLIKNFVGLSYNLHALEKRLSFNAFGKMYDLKSKVTLATDGSTMTSSFNDLGYGTAAAYFLIPEELQIKASYEHAYRLQSPIELLGDGLLADPNPNLNPESSDNVNVGFGYKKEHNTHSFGLQGNFIYREAKDFIQPIAVGTHTMSVNKTNVQVTGVDGVFNYGYKQWFTFQVNATYQKTVDMNPNGQYGTNQPNYLYKKQLPNIPILYGNADLGFYFKNLKYEQDLFSINLFANYSDSYYLNYPSLGAPEYKKSIPEQIFYSAALAYSLKNGRYNVAFECRNITNERLYDYFMVQKPGRSFTVKLRYFFM
jgi:outer membrane cobalamin receptor